jgi:hypothetical protein
MVQPVLARPPFFPLQVRRLVCYCQMESLQASCGSCCICLGCKHLFSTSGLLILDLKDGSRRVKFEVAAPVVGMAAQAHGRWMSSVCLH